MSRRMLGKGGPVSGFRLKNRKTPSWNFNPDSAFEFGKIRPRRTFLPHQYVFLTSFAPPLACLSVAAPSYGASSHHPNGNPTSEQPRNRSLGGSLPLWWEPTLLMVSCRGQHEMLQLQQNLRGKSQQDSAVIAKEVFYCCF